MYLSFQISKKQLVGTIDPLRDVLHCLCTDFFQIGEPGHLFELCEMFLQNIDVQRFVIQTIIPFVQGK